jgi:putative ABC transport system permease protein
VLSAPGAPGRVNARLFAVDPGYLDSHPWVRVSSGGLDRGALLTDALRARPGFASAPGVSVELPGTDERPVSVPLRVGGVVDLRDATTWFAVPIGDVQGDVANIPQALLVDYGTFERSVLPALRAARAADPNPVINASTTDLPPVTIESHIAVDHGAYPTDPAQAAAYSTRLRRVLERQAPESIVVADNAAEALTAAQYDATNAKILFLLLGIPGALVAAALGLAAASALAEAQRREDALLDLRGATTGQLAWLTSAHAVLAGLVGAGLGLVVAAAAVGAVTGRAVWREVAAGRLAISAALAVGAGLLTVAARVVPLVRAIRRSEVVQERRRMERGWAPGWRRSRLDLIALAVGAVILAVTVVTGGLRQTPIEGQTLALAFYVLLAPIALWFGVTLLIIRGLLALLARRTRPERSRPLSSWAGTALRWLGRRPARTGVALVLGALAVAFGTNVVTFVATYRQAQLADREAAFGSDLRLTPPVDPAPPPSHPGIAATTPIRLVPARVGTDRKTIRAIDPVTYRSTTTAPPRMLSGHGVDALTGDPSAVVVAAEIADGFSLSVGDTVTLTIFPDDASRTQNLRLHLAGVFRSFPPNEPPAELVMSAAVLPPSPPPPDYYLARVAPGRSAVDVAAELRSAAPTFTVATIANQTLSEQRSLTALNLSALSRLEALAAGLVAAVGVAVLGAFLVLERRRESAVLRAVGATTPQLLTGPSVEGAIAVLGSLLIGVPVGIGLSIVAIRVLGLFFTLAPPLLVLPGGALGTLAAAMVASSAVALGAALVTVTRQAAASVLREP